MPAAGVVGVEFVFEGYGLGVHEDGFADGHRFEEGGGDGRRLGGGGREAVVGGREGARGGEERRELRGHFLFFVWFGGG